MDKTALPKFGLRSVKVSAFASHETHCFEAVLTIDGKAVAIVSNEGMGGADCYRYLGGWTRADHDALNAQLKAGPRVDCDWVDEDGKPETVENDLEIVVGDLLNDWIMARTLRRTLAHRVLFVKGDEAGLWEIPLKKGGVVRPFDRVVSEIKKRHAGAVILNECEFDFALELFRRHATVR